MLLLREVCAAKAHISPNGKTKERFEIVAVKATQTQKLSFELTWKSAQDRYKRLQARFDTQDRTEELMSGVGGEQGEMEELLSEMRYARQDLLSRKEERRTAALEREAEKERLGAAIRQHANKRIFSSSEETLEEDSKPALSSSSRKIPRSKKPRIEMDPFKDDILIFTEVLEKGDKAQTEMKNERFMLEKRRLEFEIEERAKDREECRRERNEDRKLELEKHRLLLQAFVKNSGTGS